MTLLKAENYVELLQEYVSTSMNFYAELKGNQDFYQGLLDRAEDKYNSDYSNGYGVSYGGNTSDLAALLGDPDCVFVDENGKFRNDMTFTISFEMKEDDDEIYNNWVNLITGKFDQLDEDMIPGFSSIPASLLGSYELKVTIDKVDN